VTDIAAQPKRPAYLWLTLIVMWVLGVHSFSEGYAIVSIARSPFAMESSLLDEGVTQVVRLAFADAIARDVGRLLPLGVAQLVLGGVLVAVSTKALLWRRASPRFALQVIAANAIVLVVGYVLQEPVRQAIVEALLKSELPRRPAGTSAEEIAPVLRAAWWWSFRLKLLMQLVALGLSGLALTRPSAREYLETPPLAQEDEG